MTRYTTTDVLICGAGVTGLTLAIELARHGVSFRLIEKRTTPFIGSRGKGIQPRTQEIFEDLGILNKVVAAGGLYPRLRTYRHDGSYVDSDIAHNTKPTHAEPYHLPLMVPQNVTETIMREQLKAWGHRVEFGCELRHFAQTPRTVTAYVAGPAGEEVIIAHYLIGADGGGSFVRKKLGVSFPGRTLGIHALVADASLLKMPVLRVLIIVMLCHFFAYGMYSSQLPVFLSDTFIWNGLPFGPKALSYLLMADGVINIFVQLFLLGWVSQYFSERKLIILIFALLCTGFLTAGIATTIPVLVFAIVCISIADALAKPTYLAALSVHVSPARQGIVIGTAQALIAIADFISPVLGGFVLGYALYGVWIGIAISVAIIGLVTTMIYLSKSSVLIVKPETE